jgi:hypothetical protein
MLLALLSHAEQYQSLRDEILRILDEMHRSEFWTAAALGAVYAWLLTHRDKRYVALLWLGPTIIFVSGIRYLLLFDRIRTIAVYLRQIEQQVFRDDALPGWERYSYLHGGGPRIILTTVIAWIVMLLVSIAASYYLQRVMHRKV